MVRQLDGRLLASALRRTVRTVDARVAAILGVGAAPADGAAAVEADRVGRGAAAVDLPGPFVFRAAELRKVRIGADRVAQPVDAPLACPATGPGADFAGIA